MDEKTNYGFPEPAGDIHVKTEPVAIIESDDSVDILARAKEDQASAEERVGEDYVRHESINLQDELSDLLNRYSAENASGTPDFILAELLMSTLKNYNDAIKRRAQWRGEPTDLFSSTTH